MSNLLSMPAQLEEKEMKNNQLMLQQMLYLKKRAKKIM